ncbi:amidase domain-containing protein [Ezakiella coagulans]|uniref:amidase domain-containing protein n=1 Tax=Ezakiella coagulans TaxID=46507 RepID=UPI002014B4B8|nr:amidase domain-containing protein [Ezakiella coagulans]UQK60722.1 amidase domain-containing protein [Ezakiella coagulans]
MKRRFTLLIAMVMLLTAMATNVFASSANNNSKVSPKEWQEWFNGLSKEEQLSVNYEPASSNQLRFTNEDFKSIKDEFDTIFEINDSRTITLRGISNKMFIEFSSQEEALNKVKERCSNLLSQIKSEYNLGELSEDNWKDYYDGLYSIVDDTKNTIKISESDYEYRFLRSFFDIYENKYKNDKVDNISKIDYDKIVIDNGEEKSIKEVIAQNLPFYSDFNKEYFYETNSLDSSIYVDKFEKKSNLALRSADIDVDRAVSYATSYAENPNTSEYYYFRHGDCTNFVSQILEYSGVRQDVYESEYSGWWHKYNPSAFLNKHKHSRAWSVADVFARYMGVVLTRDNHRNFSANVFRGSIIAADFRNDGDWDHIAFVTAADGYVGDYGYYDYKVAQHTDNYHRWTSNSDNNWENIGGDGGLYGRIRY